MDRPWMRRIFCLVFAWYAISGCTLVIRANRKYQQVQDWPRTNAHIESARAYWINTSWHGYRHCARLHYRYSVNGQSIDEINQVFDFVCWPDGDDVVANHKPGTLIQIAYDPSAPEISVIPSAMMSPGFPWVSIVVGIGCVALFVMDVSGFWRWFAARLSSHHKHRRRRAHTHSR